MDMMLFAEGSVCTAPVDFVSQNPFGISAETPPVLLYDPHKLCFLAFIVGVEAETVDKGITVHNADRYLRAKLCGGFGLASDNRPDPWLRQAYYAV